MTDSFFDADGASQTMTRAYWLTLPLLLVAFSLLMAAPPETGASTRCKDVSAYESGPNITATNIRASGMGCTKARKLLRKYFRRVLNEAQTPNGCAQQRAEDGCHVDGFRCTVKGTKQLRGRCGKGRGSEQKIVRFSEYDTGPG